MDLLTALEQTWKGVFDLLDGLTDDGWNAPTPCAGWDVHDVAAHLGHLEGLYRGFEQPDPPAGFDPSPYAGFQVLTEQGVAARRHWSPDEVRAEIRRAATASLEVIRGFDESGWEQPMMSPIGTVPAHQALQFRLADAYVHLMDLRHALGRPLRPDDEPEAAEAVVARTIRLAGWGAARSARLPDGTRIGLVISGPGGGEGDLVVEGGRGSLIEQSGTATDRVTGTGLAFLLAVAGRWSLADTAGGLTVEGNTARRFVEGYALFV